VTMPTPPRIPRTPVLGGSLKLPPVKTLMIGETSVVKAAERWNTLPQVEADLKAKGIPEIVAPDVEYKPVTKEQLLSADISEYTAMYVNQLRWFNYANRVLADCKAELLQVTNQINDLEAEVKKKLRELKTEGKKLGVVEIKEQAENDEGTLDLRQRKQYLEQSKLKLEAWVEECDESKKVVSRQIELRREEGQGGRREGNLTAGNHGPPRGEWAPRGPGR